MNLFTKVYFYETEKKNRNCKNNDNNNNYYYDDDNFIPKPKSSLPHWLSHDMNCSLNVHLSPLPTPTLLHIIVSHRLSKAVVGADFGLFCLVAKL